jgi:hypothetical protein
LLGSEELVRGAIQDLESSGLSEKDKTVFRFIRKVSHHSPEITVQDMKPLYEAGWTDGGIYCAITVCALFNFYNRWIDASGVHPMSEEAHQHFGARTAHHGYVRK